MNGSKSSLNEKTVPYYPNIFPERLEENHEKHQLKYIRLRF
jgi:hypothetical protein